MSYLNGQRIEEDFPGDRKLYENYVYWTQKEVDCYNKAIDDAIESINDWWTSSNSFKELKQMVETLKKKP